MKGLTQYGRSIRPMKFENPMSSAMAGHFGEADDWVRRWESPLEMDSSVRRMLAEFDAARPDYQLHARFPTVTDELRRELKGIVLHGFDEVTDFKQAMVDYLERNDD